ncbi:MAG: hypothetical protein JJ959_08110 [Nisaea sp.]|uniref:hypothetical protein n=1 Tax=Nisaea sp. TaxID=2024842 RepID=UPI001B0F018F|nr:hypothetical protein [Nisaea sp.]MBO6560485.1 hypothetical protein [Nisaea sp.]
MPEGQPTTPSDMALAELHARIARDDGLEQKVRDAMKEDLGSANPADFERLNTVLTQEGQEDEAEEPEGE